MIGALGGIPELGGVQDQSKAAAEGKGKRRGRGDGKQGGSASPKNEAAAAASTQQSKVAVCEDPADPAYVAPLHAASARGCHLLTNYGFKPDPSCVATINGGEDLAALDVGNIRIIIVARRPHPEDPKLAKPSGDALVALCHRCPKLQQLELCASYLDNFTASHLLDIAKACPLIEAICMLEVRGFDACSAGELQRLLPRLKHISV